MALAIARFDPGTPERRTAGGRRSPTAAPAAVLARRRARSAPLIRDPERAGAPLGWQTPVGRAFQSVAGEANAFSAAESLGGRRCGRRPSSSKPEIRSLPNFLARRGANRRSQVVRVQT